jgi:hypothetical protein
MAMSIETYSTFAEDAEAVASILEREIDEWMVRNPDYQHPEILFRWRGKVPIEAQHMLQARFRLVGWQLYYIFDDCYTRIIGAVLYPDRELQPST